MNKPTDEQLINRLNEALDMSTDSLDYSAQLKLKNARAQALAQLASPTASAHSLWSRERLWWPAGALSAALTLVIVLHGQPEPTAVPDHDSVYEDIELLSSADDLDTLSDLEFYQWLDQNSQS